MDKSRGFNIDRRRSYPVSAPCASPTAVSAQIFFPFPWINPGACDQRLGTTFLVSSLAPPASPLAPFRSHCDTDSSTYFILFFVPIFIN